MDIFTSIMNHTIDVAIKKNLTSEGSISSEIYPLVKDLPIPSYYIPPAITKATAMVKNYRKSVRREEMRAKQKKNGGSKPDTESKRKPGKTKVPHVNRRMLASHYGFRIKGDNVINMDQQGHQCVYISGETGPHQACAIPPKGERPAS